jgi:hypothetical protein
VVVRDCHAPELLILKHHDFLTASGIRLDHEVSLVVVSGSISAELILVVAGEVTS